ATGLYFSVMASLLTKLFDDVGHALSVHTAGGAIAGLVAPVAAAAVAAQFGWRAGVALGAVAVLPTALLVRVVVRSTEPARPDQPMRERFEFGALRELVTRPPIAFTMVLSFVTVYVWQSLASFFPTFMIEHWRFTTQEASIALSALFLLSAVAQPFVGRLSDRIGRDRVLVVAFSLATLGMLALLGPQNLFTAGAAIVLLGLGLSWPGVRQARFMDHFSDEERGTGFGLVRTVYMFLGAFGSVVTGTIADVSGWTAAYGVVTGLIVIGLVALVANDRLELGL
ncbi:MAG: MFS transporter, partial [Halobacteriales archaeon]|nr:MFS transporter [Halobacteriales archaeon]